MADEQYKISLGVDVDTSGIQEQINTDVKNKIKPIQIDIDLNYTKKQIDTIKSQIQDLNKVKVNLGAGTGTGSSKGVKSAVNDMNWAYKQMLNVQKKINSLSIKINGLDTSKNVNELRELSSQFTRLRSDYETLRRTFGNQLSAVQFGNLQAEADETTAKLAAMDAKIKDTKANLASGIKGNFGNYSAQVESLETRFGKLSRQSTDLRICIDGVHNALTAMQTASSNGDIEGLIGANERYKQALKDVEAQLRRNAAQEHQMNSAADLSQYKTNLSLQMSNWLKDNSKAAKQFGAEIKNLQTQLNACNNIADGRRIGKAFTEVTLKAKEANVATKTFGDQIKEQFSKYTSYISVATMFMYATMAMKDMFNQVKAIDSAMTELKKVTDETDASYNQFLGNAASRAKELGTTIDGLVNSTADFAKLGYGFEESQELAEVANIYAVVGDEVDSVETATESLISTMTAFGVQASDSMGVVDRFNEVANKYAISSGGIGEALTRSASSMAAANNTIDETIALITAANTVVQDPDSVGTAFKTISMRIRGAKTELDEAGLETDGMVESTAKLREEIMALSGVDIMLDDSTFKSTYQIMDELSAKWQDLSDIQQATVTELIAGKRQGNIISSLMNNFDIARDALETSLSSSGSAMREHAKWSESLEARLNKLKSTWQSLSQSFMSSDFLKVALDLLTGIVDVLDKITSNLGTLGTIGLGAGIFSFFKGKSAWSGVLSSFKLAGQWFGNIITSSDTLTGKFKNLGRMAKMTGVDIGGALKGSLSATAGAIGLVVSAIGLAVTAYKNYKEEMSRARQETIQTSDEFLDASDSFERAYIKYSGRTDLTADEESELSSAIKGTVDALGDKSSALQGVVNSSNDYLASLEAIKNAELEAAKNAAEKKRDNAADALKEAAIGWESFDGSEVNIGFGNIGLSTSSSREAAKIAKEIDSEQKWYYETGLGKRQTGGITLSGDADLNEIIEYYNFLNDYQKALEDGGQRETHVYEQVKDKIEQMSEAVGVYVDGVYEAVKANYQLKEGVPKTTDEYIAMREAILGSYDMDGLSLDTKVSILNTLDSEYGQLFDLTSVEAQARKFVGIIKDFGDGTVDGTNEIGTVETFLNMRTAVNNNECSVGDYLNELDNVKSMSEKFSDEEKEQFNLAFGLDTDSIKEQYDDVYNYIKRNYIDTISASDYPNSINMWEYAKEVETEKIKGILDSLSATELQAVANIKGEINWETTNTDEILAQIKEEAKFVEAMNYTIAIDVETESLDALNSALSESVSGVGLSSESIEALKSRYAELASQGYDLSAMFEETSNGIHLNKSAIGEFEQALASQKLSETDDKLTTLKGRYDELTKEIETCTDAGERASLYSEQQEVAQKINDLATLASQYKGLTSAYNAWQNAESAGQERDMYESIIEGFENIGDEISRGWYDDGTIKFLELMTGKTDLAGKSASELKKIWKGLDDTIKGTSYSVRDFFTTNEDGESTSTGAYNFLRAVEELGKNGGLKALEGKNISELVERNSDGKIVSFDFDVVGGDAAIAKALGVSEEMVQIIQRTLDDAGFVVTLDGKYTLLADLKTSAEESNNALKKLQSEGLKNLKDLDLNFDFNVDTVEGYQEQLEKALTVLDKFRNKDGTLQTDKDGNLVKGAKEALEIAEYYTAAMDKLTEPKFMQIDTSTVDSELQDPIEKMQTIGDLCKEKHLVSLTGDTKELDKVQGEIDKVAKEIEELDPEVKAQIGIDDSWDAKTIADKIEKGEIEIPAELKLDVQMSEDLKDIRLLMMRQLGLVDDNEIKLKIGYDIDDSTVDKLIKDGKEEIVIEFITKNEEWFDKLTDDKKEIVIDLVSSGVDLSSIEDEKKKVVVEYIEKDAEWFNKLDDEEKKVVVNYVAEHGEIDKWSPEAKEAFVKYLVDGGDPDTFDPENKESWVVYKKDTDIPDSYIPINPNALVTYDKDSSVPDNYDPNDPDATVKYGKDSLIPDSYIPLDPPATVVFNKDTSAVDSYNPPDIFRTVYYTIKETVSRVASGGKSKVAQRTGANPDGKGTVNGTANVNGTTGRAFKQGSWGTKDSGTALVGELGREILVRQGRYYTIGDSGAEFIKYQRGDIIFNHKQTEELFKYGKVTADGGRAKALVNGTAFTQGTAFGNGTGGGEEPDLNDKDSENKFEDTIDWIETILKRAERAIDKYEQQADNVYKTWSKRNKALENEIAEVDSTISLYEQAKNKYLSEANKVGLDENYAKKVRNGSLSVEDFEGESDEKLVEKIKNYQDLYEKYLDCIDKIDELKEKEASLYSQRFDHVSEEYDNLLQGFEHTETMLNEYISQAEENGYIVSTNYYNALIDNEKDRIDTLKQEQSALITARDEAVANGEFDKYSEDWYRMCQDIDEVTQAIESGTTNLIEYKKAIDEIDFEKFELAQDYISDVIDEADFLIELMSNKDLYDDKGNLTEQGASTLGLHGLKHNTYMYQADDYAAKIEEIDSRTKLDKNHEDYLDPLSKDVIDKRREYVELQRECILNAEQEKQAISDLVADGIDKELDALSELIDAKNESLEAEKDLYEYQKQVQEQTENIASIRKEMAAYENDGSEEAKAKIQELKVSLEDAEADLKETEWDRYIDQQAQLLDTLYTEYETILNSRLDNIDYLLAQVVDGINAATILSTEQGDNLLTALGSEGTLASALGVEGAIASAIVNAVGENGSIKGILNKEVTAVGTKLSTAMNSIWSVGEGNAKSILTTYGEGFQGKQTTTNQTLSGIKISVDKMANASDKEAQKKVTANKTTTSAKKNPTKNTATNKTNNNKSSGGDGKPKVGDKVKFISGKYYYDSQGKKPLGSKYQGKQVYITKINTDKWATHPYHISTGNKLGKGDLGWLKLNQLSGYATGKQNFLDDEIAWTQENGKEFIVRPSDGAILTPIAKGDSVLTSAASNNIWDMANSPADFIKDSLGIGSANVPNNSTVQNVYNQTIENVTFDFKNVKNYEEMLHALKDDRRFEKLVTAMTIDRVAGKSALAKGKSIRN